MTRSLLVLIALVALAAAAVTPIYRGRRDSPDKPMCEDSTPCFWTAFETDWRLVEVNVTNQYCICRPGTVCSFYVDRVREDFLEYRCKEVPI